MKSVYVVLGSLLMVAAARADGITEMWGPRAAFQVTFRVVDDEGEPVEGAQFGCNWGSRGFAAPDYGQIKGVTGPDGVIVVVGKSVFNEFNYHAEKSGYYPVRSVGYDRPLFERRLSGRWKPWNPTVELTLKQVRNPVPMYARKVTTEIPVKGIPVGFDLQEGDWVKPYGRGRTEDVRITGRGEVWGDRNYDGEINLVFLGAGNGMLAYDVAKPDGSVLRMPYEAPSTGYTPVWTWKTKRSYDAEKMVDVERIDEPPKTRNFFFRVRTIVDGQGNVVQAWYGKIHGPVYVGLRGRGGLPGVSFTYYLNPDGTRNVEFDPKRNLFKPTKPNDSAFWNLGP